MFDNKKCIIFITKSIIRGISSSLGELDSRDLPVRRLRCLKAYKFVLKKGKTVGNNCVYNTLTGNQKSELVQLEMKGKYSFNYIINVKTNKVGGSQ